MTISSNSEIRLSDLRRFGTQTRFQKWLAESNYNEKDFMRFLGLTVFKMRRCYIEPQEYLTVRMINILSKMINKTPKEIFDEIRLYQKSPTTAKTRNELNLLIRVQNELHK